MRKAKWRTIFNTTHKLKTKDMNTIEINIKINKNVYKKWSLYFKGGDMFVAYSLEKDIKGKLKELGVNGYDMETKISEQLIIES